ncbi:hypothetical protein ABN028_34135 [Actinopolymorpha sp. B17G11]|uniref:hypothetical protein n=1 Tax=Actinopolymorpha sp. B17G11 TaxID=3160861 RepID=UPI0032E50C42
MVNLVPSNVVLLAVGDTQIFNLADGRTVMVVAIPATLGTGGGGPTGGNQDGNVASDTKPIELQTVEDVPTLGGGHIAAILVGDAGQSRNLEDVDFDELLTADSLTFRFQPSDPAETPPGVRIVSDNIVAAVLSENSSEVVVRPDTTSGES